MADFNYLNYLADLQKEFPKVRIVPKTSWAWRALGTLVWLVTFGRNRSFLTSYITTIGHTIAVPADWATWEPNRRIAILIHERTHLRQSKDLGALRYCLEWLCWPLPLGLAWGRYRLEREAYQAQIYFWKGGVGSKADADAKREAAIVELSGAAYGWAWPFRKSVRAWFERNT